jgi:hypothetical protein
MRLAGLMSHRRLYFASRISQANKLKIVIHRDSQCPTSPVTLRRIKLNCVINTGKIVNRFGNALLIKRSGGKHELVGGSDRDYTEAKEWVSLFAHEIVFSRKIKRQQHPNFCFGPRQTSRRLDLIGGRNMLDSTEEHDNRPRSRPEKTSSPRF